MIKPWIFEFFHALPTDEAGRPGAVKQQFDRHLALWERDEALGFEGVFFSEHHFGTAYSPVPHLLVAAMASRTKTLRLGTLGVSAAYVTALRFVEEAAMLDNLTDGRFEVGLVRGIPPELSQLGMSTAEADERFERILREADAAFRASDALACGGLTVVPPLRQSPPPRWLAITSERSARRAAGIGWKACTGFLPVDKVRTLFDAYREDAELDWEISLDHLGLRRRVLFVQDRSEAPEAKRQLKQRAIDHVRHALSTAPGAQPIIDLDAATKDMLSEDEFIAGTPRDVAEEIIAQCRTAGCAHFLAGLDSTDVFEEMRQAHETFGREVVPLLRKADLSVAEAAA